MKNYSPFSAVSPSFSWKNEQRFIKCRDEVQSMFSKVWYSSLQRARKSTVLFLLRVRAGVVVVVWCKWEMRWWQCRVKGNEVV